MKVMMFYPSNLSRLLGGGGVQQSTKRLMGALTAKGIHCALLLVDVPAKDLGWAANYGVYFVTPYSGDLGDKIHKRLWRIKSLLQFHSALLRFGASILHVQGTFGDTRTAAIAASLPRSWKMIVTFRGYDNLDGVRENEHARRSLILLCQKADAVTAISHETAVQVANFLGVALNNIHVIPNGVDSLWIEPPLPHNLQTVPYVLYVGRLHPVKGVDLLFGAWQAVMQHSRDVQLWIVGDGPERQSLECLARELGIEGHVRFWGAVHDMMQLKSLYSGARALVLPSRSEGLGNVLLEAGACGTICIGSDVGGIPEVIVDRETGFLFPSGDVEALARTIQHVLEMPEGERQHISQRARQRIQEHFSLERVVDQYVELYQEVLTKQR